MKEQLSQTKGILLTLEKLHTFIFCCIRCNRSPFLKTIDMTNMQVFCTVIEERKFIYVLKSLCEPS